MLDENKPSILIIDDDETNIRLLEVILEEEHYQIFVAKNGFEGLEILKENHHKINTILLDFIMPNMDGPTFLKKIKNDALYKHIPVIIQSANSNRDDVLKCIKLGVYHYIVKPFNKENLISKISEAIEDHKKYNLLKKSVELFKQKKYLFQEGSFLVRDHDDIRFLSNFLAKFYTHPDKAVFGIYQLLTNALEHGNLCISFEEKKILITNSKWADEVAKRLSDPAHINKFVHVNFKKENDKIILTITDQGKGFDWNKYNNFNFSNTTQTAGKGIALSKVVSFESVEYIYPGNKVVCISS